MIKIVAPDEEAMLALGSHLSQLLKGSGAVFIRGQLGAGKTTLCRGLLRAMGHSAAVKSPTFTMVEPYEIGASIVFHFDLYRLSDPGELDYIGIDEYFAGGGLCLVEWPEKAVGCLPQHDLEIFIDVSGEKRNISVEAMSADGETICEALTLIYGQH